MEEEQENFYQLSTNYKSGVGMLLYLVKHLHPHLANLTRALLKAYDSTNPAAYKEHLCVIRYIINMKNVGLKGYYLFQQ